VRSTFASPSLWRSPGKPVQLDSRAICLFPSSSFHSRGNEYNGYFLKSSILENGILKCSWFLGWSRSVLVCHRFNKDFSSIGIQWNALIIALHIIHICLVSGKNSYCLIIGLVCEWHGLPEIHKIWLSNAKCSRESHPSAAKCTGKIRLPTVKCSGEIWLPSA
jgi:hypothetical protein